MNKNYLVFFCLFLFEQTILQDTNRKVFYLPMKKDHKYGDDICYYRDEVDDKHYYVVYYVKPCEKGKYCETEVDNQPFGFCRDILTNATDFPIYEENCNSNGECLKNVDCINGKCTRDCSNGVVNNPDFPIYNELNKVTCKTYGTKTTNDAKYCYLYEPKYMPDDPKYYYLNDETIGKYPGLPKECGIIHYKSITDFERQQTIPTTGSPYYKTYTRWLIESKEWCNIGDAEDGTFVVNKRFCKSGFTLRFYPNGDLVDPSYEEYIPNTHNYYYSSSLVQMCVTPIQIDKSNPEVGTIVTYKVGTGNELKYNYYKYYDINDPYDNLDEESVIKSQLYTEFIEEFKNASDEDKKSCYRLPQGEEGNCQNIKLLKLYYFYNHIKEYLFYKNRKDLEKVLHFKIQNIYHRYYELSSYLNFNYLFLLLILILL